MKLCYVDETGIDGKSPLLVMVGIVADSTRIRRTATDFSRLMDDAAELSAALKELKGVDIYRGNGAWKGVHGDTRHELIGDLCEWIAERKHSLALAALDLKRAKAEPLHDLPPWLAAALHIALQLQKTHQGLQKNKGQTFLVFDQQVRYADRLAELLFAPPPWTDGYYQRKKTQDPLDQILDTAFYARSHQVGLVQVADVFAFVFRRYAEIKDYGDEERYAGELARLEGWVELLAGRLVTRGNRWPRRPDSEGAKWYCRMAPSCLDGL